MASMSNGPAIADSAIPTLDSLELISFRFEHFFYLWDNFVPHVLGVRNKCSTSKRTFHHYKKWYIRVYRVRGGGWKDSWSTSRWNITGKLCSRTMISLELDVCWNLEVRYVLSRDIRRSLKIDGELNHVKYMQAKWKGQWFIYWIQMLEQNQKFQANLYINTHQKIMWLEI